MNSNTYSSSILNKINNTKRQTYKTFSIVILYCLAILFMLLLAMSINYYNINANTNANTNTNNNSILYNLLNPHIDTDNNIKCNTQKL